MTGASRGRGGGASLTTIKRQGLLSGYDGYMDGLVPSGVASVTLNYPAGRDRAPRVPPLRVTWRMASGHVIKTINETPSTPTLTRPLICRVSTDIR